MARMMAAETHRNMPDGQWTDITYYTTKQRLFGPRNPETMAYRVMDIDLLVFRRIEQPDKGWFLDIYSPLFKITNLRLECYPLEEAEQKAIRIVKHVLIKKRDKLQNALDELEYLDSKS